MFASHWSGLSIPEGAVPQIERAQEYQSIKLCNQCKTRALTNGKGVIFLAEEWQEDNLDDQCVLAHELVHWLQQQHGVDMRPSIAEPPAYMTEAICLQLGKDHDDGLITFKIKQAAKYGYGDYKTSVR